MGKIVNAVIAAVLGFFLGYYVSENSRLEDENNDLYDAIEDFVGGQIKHVGGTKRNEHTLN